MNVLPCEVDNGRILYRGQPVEVGNPTDTGVEGRLEIGVRPEFVRFAREGIPVSVEKVDDLGRFQIATVTHESDVIKLVVEEDCEVPWENTRIRFEPEHTLLYRNDWVVDEAAR